MIFLVQALWFLESVAWQMKKKWEALDPVFIAIFKMALNHGKYVPFNKLNGLFKWLPRFKPISTLTCEQFAKTLLELFTIHFPINSKVNIRRHHSNTSFKGLTSSLTLTHQHQSSIYYTLVTRKGMLFLILSQTTTIVKYFHCNMIMQKQWKQACRWINCDTLIYFKTQCVAECFH